MYENYVTVARRNAGDYFKLHKSAKEVTRLTDKKLRYAIRECKKGRKTFEIAAEIGVSQRQIQRLYTEFRKTGTAHTLGLPGRKPVKITSEKILMVLQHCKKEKMDAHYTAKLLKDNGQDIIYREAYQIMQGNGLITPSPAKSKRRKWVRYERKHSNSMWHVDWHIGKDLRLQGLNLVAFLDDASRCVTGSFLFPEATSYNSVLALRAAISKFDKPATILSDNGSCFTSRKRCAPLLMETHAVWRRTTEERNRTDKLKTVSPVDKRQAGTVV